MSDKPEYLWWSKDSDLNALPEMRPATPEQLSRLNIVRDDLGTIIAVQVKPETEMTDEELDAELRSHGLDPEEVQKDVLSKLFLALQETSVRIGKLQEALRRYGRHEPDCHAWPSYREHLCSCGLATLIAIREAKTNG